jgi:hypothetical protein
MTRLLGLRIALAVHAASFVLSCILGPLRGHGLLISAFGGFALGPLNLILIFTLEPPRKRQGRDQDPNGHR